MKQKNQQIISIVFITLCIISCHNDLEDELCNSNHTATIQMTAKWFGDGDHKSTLSKMVTRSSVVPGNGGTSFAWSEGDVSAVYSSGKGLTNFIIDKNTISDDSISASFNGSGFTLVPNSMYYAFYPYNPASLDKAKIIVNYTGQNIKASGDFESLSQYDYMWARGVSNQYGNVGFNFAHLGCVVEFSLEVPQTANYTQVRFELENNTDQVSLIKTGIIDLTSSTPTIQDYNNAATDTIMRVDINNGEGVAVEKGEILKVYIMMAPQDLSVRNMVIRLVDNQGKWYTSNTMGKNMKAGYTYHYYVGSNTAGGGFTGTGVGLPDDVQYKHMSTYVHPKASAYEDLYVDGNYVYAVGHFGIRKIDFTNDTTPLLLVENTSIVDNYTRARSVVGNGNYLYVNVRQNSWGTNEVWKPQIRYNFETPVTASTESRLSNNATLNSFFKNFSVNRDITRINSVTIYKAYQRSDGFRNAIVIRVSGESDIIFLGKTYSTRQAAIDALTNSYTNNNGDYCEVDWNAIPEGPNDFTSLQFYYSRGVELLRSSTANILFDGTPSPNQGHCSAKFTSGISSSSYAVIKTEKPTASVGEFSYWLNITKSFNQTIKCLLTYTNTTCRLRVNCIPTERGFYMSLNNTPTSKVFNIGEWYNVKVKTSPAGTSLYYRTAECSDWILLSSNSIPSDEFDAVSIGISTAQSNAEVLIDDFYFNETDVDKVSYVNGKTYIFDKSNLSVINRLNLDYRVTGLAVANDIMIVSGLYNVKFYDVSIPSTPKWLYTYRPDFDRDMQGVTTFYEGGRYYAVVCCYSSGFMIWDITDKNAIKVVCDEDFSNLMVNGMSAKGRINCFSSIVDYPYIYTTISPTPSYISTHKEVAGIMRVDISDVFTPIMKIYNIPSADVTSNTAGDPSPTRIAKYRNTLFLNNREKGLASFDISPKEPSYIGNYQIGTSLNPITITPDGRIFTGDDNSIGTDRNLYYIRFE